MTPDVEVSTRTAAYWDGYRAGRGSRKKALRNAFGWTQYPNHGPGDELLGNPETALELGCGRGDAVAALAIKGVRATGVDMAKAQVSAARKRWGHLPEARYVRADVCRYLAGVDQQWETIFSIWGALWFTDPRVLLPLVHDRLIPGGKLVFGHAPPVPGSYGVQGMYGFGFSGRQVWIHRWAYDPGAWVHILREHGFVRVNARVEPAPKPDHVGTLIVESERPA